MKVLILMGSPRLHGNTAELCKYFMEELPEQKAEIYLKQDIPYELLKQIIVATLE